MSANHSYPVFNKKQILAAPLDAFNKTNSNSEDKDKVKLLSQQLLTQKQRHQELQNQSKKFSRKIGEAKRNNEPTNDLKTSMQQLSRELKQVAQQSTKIEEKLLTYFELSTTDIESAATQTIKHPYNKRNYIDTGTGTVNIDSITIKNFDNDHAAWNDYVKNNPAGCIHHRIEWAQLFEKTYQHQCFYFIAHDENRKIVGILPLVRLKSRLFGDLLVSMPYFQRAGALANHPLIEQALMHHANQQAKSLNIDHIEYRDDIRHEGLPAQSHKVNMVLPLPEDTETLWKNFSAKLRSQIKRPQREKPDVLFGREELLNEFYAVYSRNMRDLGSPVHSKIFIANILHHFPENSHLVVIKHKQKAVSAALLLANNNTMEIPLASTIRDVNHLSINMLLYWEILQFAIKHGNKFFDFGRSTKNAGTYKFKQQWGALPQPLYWHYWLKDGHNLPELNPSNPKYALLIFIWKRLPLALANIFGPKIVKNIP